MPNHFFVAAVAFSTVTGCANLEEPVGETREMTASPAEFRIAEDAIDDLMATRTILKKSAAVVEVLVEKIGASYDEHVGPRTDVHVRVQSVLFGKLAEERTVLHLFGGATDDGKMVSTSRSVRLVPGGRYVLFLRNDGWFYDPLLGAALRVETVHDREVLVSPDGRALTAITPEGLSFGVRPLFERTTGDGAPALAADVTPLDVAGTLDRARLVGLVREAIAFERIGPSGVFHPAPAQRPSWRIVPTDRDPGFVGSDPNGAGVTSEQPLTSVEPQ